jgi:hypothetical protein
MGLRQDVPRRHALLDQVVAAHASLGEAGVSTAAAGNDDERRQPSLLQGQGMVEPSLEDRGRVAIVLRRSKNHAGRGGPRLISPGLTPDGMINRNLPSDPGPQQN